MNAALIAIASAMLWNSLLAAIFAGLLIVGGRRPVLQRRPALRQALWLLVLLKLITPPLVPVPVLPDVSLISHYASELPETTRPNAPSPGTPSAASSSPADSSLLSSPMGDHLTPVPQSPRSESWRVSTAILPTAVVTASLLGGGVLIGLALVRGRRIGRLLYWAATDSDALQREADRLGRQMGLLRGPAIRVVDADLVPLLWMTWRGPIIVLPRRLIDHLDEAQVANVIAHEIAHYVRWDHWTSWLAFGVSSVFWWNPVAWYARRQLREVQEECCDALVVARGRPNGAATRRRCWPCWTFSRMRLLRLSSCPASATCPR